MFIKQLEYREKPTATNWKRISFPLKVCFQSEDPALAVRLLDHIAALTVFGRNDKTHQFADAISRMLFHTGHQEFMWFAKSTLQNGQLLTDEEELYDQNNTMLMRRAFGELSVGNNPVEPIPQSESMLVQHTELETLQKIQHGFALVQYHHVTDDNQEQILQQILQADHGTLILIDGTNLTQPLDLAATIARNDIQVLAVNCKNLPEMHIIKKGKMISCQ